MSERVVALSTVGSAEDAERIARALVERGLAACVNVVPGVVSIYRWQGAVERAEERLLVMKTRRDRLEALRRELVALHPYDVPELVALDIEGGHGPYLDWIDESVRSEEPTSRGARPRPPPARAGGRPRGRPRPRSPR